jgi:hypothetical protein
MTRKAAPERASAAMSGVLAAHVVVGQLLPGSTSSQPLVDFPGNALGPLQARSTLRLDASTLAHAVTSQQGVLLAFDRGDPSQPIVVGLIQAAEESPFQALLATPREASPPEPKAPREARLDGQRVVLEGKREVVLQCGEASLTLRSDGKVLIRGAYVETYSKGVNRIKGGAVKIN